MTCKDCIHYNVCVIVEHQADEDEDHLTEFGCEDFLDKNDVVKVVRCKDCESYNGHRWCSYLLEAVLDDDFCSYGKKVE